MNARRNHEEVQMQMLNRQYNSLENLSYDQMKIEVKNKNLILIDIKDTLLRLLRKVDTINVNSQPSSYLKYLFEEKKVNKSSDWKISFLIVVMLMILTINISILIIVLK